MKLHLPKTLRAALAAVAAIALPVAATVATGVFVLAGTSQQAQAEAVITTITTTNLDDNITYSGPIYTWDATKANQGTFHSATFNLYSQNEDGTAMVTGANIVGTTNNTPPGATVANTLFWCIFVGPGGNNVNSYGYGATLRLAGATSAVSTNATFGPITIGGLISVADTDSASYVFGRTNGDITMQLKGHADTGVNMNIGATTTLNAQHYKVQSSGTWNVAKTLTFGHRSGGGAGVVTVESGNTITTTGAGTVDFSIGLTLAGTAAINNGATMTIGNLVLGDGASITNTGTMSIAALSASSSTIANSGTLTINGALMLEESGISLTNTAGTLNISGPLTTTLAYVQTGDSAIQYTDGSNGFRSGSASKVLISGEGALNVTADTISVDGTAYNLTKDEHSISVTVVLPSDDYRYYVVDGNVAYGDAGNGAASSQTTGIVLAGGDLTMKQGLTDTAKTNGIQVTHSGATITLDGDATTLATTDLHIDTGVTGTKLNGSGTYEIGASMNGVALADEWTGTVHTTGTGDVVRNFDFGSCVNANSKLEVSNWKGYLSASSGALGSNELIMGEGDALTITNGYSDTYYTLKKISGTGHLVRDEGATGAYINLKVTESIEDWTGHIQTKVNSGGVRVCLAGNGDMEMSNAIDMEGGMVDFAVEGSGVKTFSSTISKTAGTLNLRTAGTAIAKLMTSELTFGTYEANGGGVTGTTMSVVALNLNGNTTITDSDITVTGTRLNLKSGTMTLDNSTLTVNNTFDARGSNPAFTGGIAVTNESVLDLQAQGWMRTNTFSVDKTSTIKQSNVEITAKGDTAATITMTDDGGERTIPGSDKVTISGATVTYKGTGEGTVAAALTGSNIVAETGSVKLTNTGNSLTGIHAKGGDVILAADHTVTRVADSNWVGNVKLTAGRAIKIADGKTLSYDDAKFAGVGASAAVTSSEDTELSLWGTGAAGVVTFTDMAVTIEAVNRSIYATLANSSINVQGGTSTFKTAQDNLSGITVGAGAALVAEKAVTVNGNVNVAGTMTVNSDMTATNAELTGSNASISIANGATFTSGDESVASNDKVNAATISGTGTVSVATSTLKYNNAYIQADSDVNIAATLNNSTVKTAGGDATMGASSVTATTDLVADNGAITISGESATAKSLTVAAGQDVVVDNNGDTGSLTVATADVASYVDAKLTVTGSFEAKAGAAVTELTISSTGTLKLNAVQSDALTVGNETFTVDYGQISFSDALKAAVQTELTDLTVSKTVVLLNNALGSINVTGVPTMTSAEIATAFGFTGLLPEGATLSLGNIPSASGTMSLDGTTDSWGLLVSVPSSLTVTEVTGASFAGGVLTLTTNADPAGGALTDNVNLTVGNAAWDQILGLVGDPHQYVTIAFADIDLNGHTVTLNGYAGEADGTHFVAFIPEPTTGALSVLALAALAMRRRRKAA